MCDSPQTYANHRPHQVGVTAVLCTFKLGSVRLFVNIALMPDITTATCY